MCSQIQGMENPRVSYQNVENSLKIFQHSLSGHTPKANETIMAKSSSGRGPWPEHPLPSLSLLWPMQNPCGERLTLPRHSMALSLCSWQQCQLVVSVLAKAHGRRLSQPGKMGITSGKKQKHLTYPLLPSHPILGDASLPWTESAPARTVPQLSMELLPAPGLGLLACGIPVLCPSAATGSTGSSCLAICTLLGLVCPPCSSQWVSGSGRSNSPYPGVFAGSFEKSPQMFMGS